MIAVKVSFDISPAPSTLLLQPTIFEQMPESLGKLTMGGMELEFRGKPIGIDRAQNCTTMGRRLQKRVGQPPARIESVDYFRNIVLF